MGTFFTLKLDGDKLALLDQTRLPGEEVYLCLAETEEIREAICSLRVRGAPAIGVAAAYGMYLAARYSGATDYSGLRAAVAHAKERFASSRPTAINLFWALKRMWQRLDACAALSVARIMEELRDEALRIHEEDRAACIAIGDFGLTLLRPGVGIYTHCNAGALAATEYGTALSPIYRGYERGYRFRVFADETRPLLQGARLTAWELCRAGVEVTLVCEGMCHSVMKQGLVDACIVGCDRLAANGDAVNKIGTATLATVARSFGIPFYVAVPVSTFDFSCKTGDDVLIEQRDSREVTSMWYGRSMAPEGVKVYNPAFDVTPHGLITALITEQGVVYPPYDENLSELILLQDLSTIPVPSAKRSSLA